MKLGCIYTVFNGIELLKKSIEQIINDVDVIAIVYQETSNRGFEDGNVRHKIGLALAELKSAEKIYYIPFVPNLGIDTKTNELNKHNVGLKFLKMHECTHFFLSATDHYYNTFDFRIAKEKCEARDFDVTLTSMFTYYKHPTWQINPIEDYYMPFICKIYPQTEYIKTKWKYLVDPSVRINTDKAMHLFSPHEIMMHHYSMIRTDIENKFNNAAASSRWGEKAKIYLDEYNSASLESKLAYFGGRGLIEVENLFGI
jgi:hypothetical protein